MAALLRMLPHLSTLDVILWHDPWGLAPSHLFRVMGWIQIRPSPGPPCRGIVLRELRKRFECGTDEWAAWEHPAVHRLRWDPFSCPLRGLRCLHMGGSLTRWGDEEWMTVHSILRASRETLIDLQIRGLCGGGNVGWNLLLASLRCIPHWTRVCLALRGITLPRARAALDVLTRLAQPCLRVNALFCVNGTSDAVPLALNQQRGAVSLCVCEAPSLVDELAVQIGQWLDGQERCSRPTSPSFRIMARRYIEKKIGRSSVAVGGSTRRTCVACAGTTTCIPSGGKIGSLLWIHHR